MTLQGSNFSKSQWSWSSRGDFHAHLPTATGLQAAVSPVLETKGMEEQDKIKEVQLFHCIS